MSSIDQKTIGRINSRLSRVTLYSKGWVKSYFTKKQTREDYPIDIVVTWVDGNDENWRKEKEKYLSMTDVSATNAINPQERYREWGLMPYWFRAIEKYAPWVHAVYFITCGQKPDWLDTRNSKLRIVSHRDFIPPEYLPTFCSDVIELNLWRIEDLSDHFIYFNDDMFLNCPVKPEDFFMNGQPKLHAVAEPICICGENGKMLPWTRRQFNNFAIINEQFDIKKAIEKNPEKWFSHVYGSSIKYNKRIYEDTYMVGMRNTHNLTPFQKETFRQIWRQYPHVLDETCRRKFRTYKDVTIYLVTFWQIFQGSFYPVATHYYGFCFGLSKATVDKIVSELRKASCKVLCLNDGHETHEDEVEAIRIKLFAAFNEKFPEKSSFER